jgi:thioredoxin reductase (NADPH)
MRDVIIIGSGPAGLTAAIYAARADLSPLVIEGSSAGGQLMTTTEVENFPGFKDGILGPDLMLNMREQAARFGAEFVQGDATAVNLAEHPFTVEVFKETHRAKALIVATGASAKWLGIESEQALIGHGVSACATCDGFFFRGKQVAVVGGGDSAIEEATFLTKFATQVTIIHRRNELRASRIMQDRARANPKIQFIWDTVVEDILDPKEGHVTGLVLRNVKTGERSTFPVDGVFMAIGHQPNTALFRGQLEMDATGYIITSNGTKTSVPGVFAAGDVADRVYRQAITAAGSGCIAAIDAERYLQSLGE